MLIPSIDLQGGRIVQLVQGERLAIESADVDGWIANFRGHRRVQLVDLDAAKATGRHDALVARICRELPCRVGGGIRTVERAAETLARGAVKVILGSALFRDREVDVEFAAHLADRVGPDRLIAAVDSRAGRVVTHGWRRSLDLSPVDAVRALEPYVGEFLYTHVDREGLMQGTDLDAIERIRNATTRALSAAGGISTHEEVEYLQSIQVDAVVGMALYTGRMAP
jgi:phosphoribosylformimino-5-aminoimidazole carboxamide ribotide isomerase